MDTIVQDTRYALRVWRQSPGFAATAILTLALGIGANTTMFSVVNATLLRALPFPEPDRLMTVWKGRTNEPASLNITSWPNFRDWVTRNHVFQHMALFDSAGRGYNLSGSGEPEQVSGLRVTASFFDVLGTKPLLGRTFMEEEEAPGRDNVVVLSHALWTRRYGADASLIGRTIQIDNRPHAVVGVMPPEFQFQFWGPLRQLWVPAGWTKGDHERGSNSFISIGRLKPGVSASEAQAEMDVIGRALAEEHPGDNTGWTVRLVPMTEYGMESLRQVLLAMLAVVGFVLLIACVNVANLMLARAATRHRELAIRCALGAGRGRIVRQLLTESVMLAIAGGALGFLLAVWGTNLLTGILPNNLRFVPLRPLSGIRVDGVVLVFTAAISCISGILFGLAPALAALRGDLNNPLKESGRGSTAGGKSRVRYGLVASEVALTLVTVAGAAVMIVSVARLLGVHPGLDPTNVLVMQMSLPQENLYYGPPGNVRFCEDLDRHVGSVPGVTSVSGIAHLPLGGGSAGRSVGVEGRPDPGPGNRPGAGYSVACPNLLRTLGIPLAAGREFSFRDMTGTPDVVLVNESMAEQFWPKENAVGKRFKIGNVDSSGPWLTVVGVYRNIRHGGLDSQSRAWFLRPYSQAGWPSLTIVAKTASASTGFVTPIRKAIAAVDPTQPVSNVRTMEAVIGASVSSRRFPMLLLSGFAALALVLAAVGIAGVVGYSVVQRTPEIGVRMALGAQSGDVLRLVIGHSLLWTLAGVAVGIVASIGLLRLLATLLFAVKPADPVVLGAVALVLVGVSLAATYLPARRAARVDPLLALRGE
jgi:putative ABC transport system permease protein